MYHLAHSRAGKGRSLLNRLTSEIVPLRHEYIGLTGLAGLGLMHAHMRTEARTQTQGLGLWACILMTLKLPGTSKGTQYGPLNSGTLVHHGPLLWALLS